MMVARDSLIRTTGLMLIGAGVLVGMSACAPSTQRPEIPLPTGTAQSVIITTDRPSYRSSEPIGVTIQNSSAAGYYAFDNHSVCTIIQLQERLHGAWQDVLPCVNGPPPRVLQIAPHASFPLTLAPGNALGDVNAWQPGVYRIALTYGTKADASDASTQSYSAGFQIGG